MSVQAANKAVKHLVNSWLVLEKKTEAANAYLIKNSKGEGQKDKKKRKKGTLTSSRKDWAEFYGCIEQVSDDQFALQWQALENLAVCLSHSLWERERERELGNFNTPGW